MCKSKDGNKEVSSSSAEKPLNLSLIFYPSGTGPYAVDTIDGKLMVKGWSRAKEFVFSDFNDKEKKVSYKFDDNDSLVDKILASDLNNKMKESLVSYLNIDEDIRNKKMIPYFIDIINDSLIILEFGIEKYKGKLTDVQYMEIKKMVSVLNQTYDWSKKESYDTWGCTLKIDNQIYYIDNKFTFTTPSKEELDRYPHLRSTPKEIKILIDYIIDLSPVPIKLYGFA
jgi:hypothetical protein